MAIPASRSQFKEYCLRKLGHPVIQINVADEQIEDRIDEALEFWQNYHYNGSETVYIKHQVTATDMERGWIEVPERLIGVVRIFDLNSSISAGSGMFNVTYQFVLNNITDIAGYSIENYFMTMQHIRFIQEWLVGVPMIRYNKHANKVHLDFKMSKLTLGNYIIVEAYDIMDGTENNNVWSDRWLQNYTTVLIKEQWGSHLTKFTNYQLVGGVQFNGEQIYNDAKEERKLMEQEAVQSLQPLIYNMTG